MDDKVRMLERLLDALQQDVLLESDRQALIAEADELLHPSDPLTMMATHAINCFEIIIRNFQRELVELEVRSRDSFGGGNVEQLKRDMAMARTLRAAMAQANRGIELVNEQLARGPVKEP